MTSINDLLNKKSQKLETPQNGKDNNTSSSPKIKTPIRIGKTNPVNSQNIKSPGIKLKTPDNKSTNSNGAIGNQIYSVKPTEKSPLQELSDTLSDNSKVSIPSIKDVLGENATSNEIASETSNAQIEKTHESNNSSSNQRQSNFDNPTLDDVAKFVFKEQPDDSTIDITDKFSEMLDTLSESVGSEVPSNLATCLKFIKEHAFLADILKPEYIGTMVAGMRKSYGFIVQVQTEKSTKRSAKKEKEAAILGDLEELSF